MPGQINSFSLTGKINEPVFGVTAQCDQQVMFRITVPTYSRKDPFRDKDMSFSCIAFGGVSNYFKYLRYGDMVTVSGILQSHLVHIGDSLRYWRTNLLVRDVVRCHHWAESKIEEKWRGEDEEEREGFD